ncbi:MAG: hypothetical protein ABF979_11705 [Gluconobacter sp.]|jgi:hypothetical protein|uniref:hypothetical protein n=1 Tax=Gluconobacter sp. TaxID=1876758 RepID=UPI0039ED3845
MQNVAKQAYSCAHNRSPADAGVFRKHCVVKDIKNSELILHDGKRVEIKCGANGIFIRTQDDAPLSTSWHGPYPDRLTALSDFGARRAIPKLTAEDIQRKKNHGYYSVVDGVPMVLHHCAWTGATILTPFDLVPAH